VSTRDDSSLSLVVGIATAGRREQLTRTLRVLALQTRRPDLIVICPATDADFDVDAVADLGLPLRIARGSRGLCAQRNAIMKAAPEAHTIAFFDDDFYAAPTYLRELEHLLVREHDAVIVTGSLLADGASGPGISHDEAIAVLHSGREPEKDGPARETYGGYGCNMALRMSIVREHDLWFDEQLPLYGWLEDIDFSRRAAHHGRIVRNPEMRGVHLGAKGGRASGVRLGYSQVANPLYMVRKGNSVSFSYAWRHVWRNCASNLVRSVSPEPWVDRRGRLRGNAIAARDLLLGSMHPQRIMDF
jgi:GT2 family glycosyltransferase